MIGYRLFIVVALRLVFGLFKTEILIVNIPDALRGFLLIKSGLVILLALALLGIAALMSASNCWYAAFSATIRFPGPLPLRCGCGPGSGTSPGSTCNRVKSCQNIQINEINIRMLDRAKNMFSRLMSVE